MKEIAVLLRKIDDLVWGPWMLILLLGTGVYLMIRMDFLPIRNLGYALKCVVGLDGEKGKSSKIMQYGFYAFYPVHMIILYLIRYFFI